MDGFPKKSFERQCEINLFIKLIVASGQARLATLLLACANKYRKKYMNV